MDSSEVQWICQQNLAGELATWMQLPALLDYIPTTYPWKCEGEPRVLDLDKRAPESEWPECAVCGETMVPFMEVIRE